MNETYIGKVWELKTRVENQIFEDYNFTETNFNHPVFKNVIFKNCLFYKANLDDARFYNCDFINCQFKNINFSNSTIGAHGGIYENCVFQKSNFRGASFYFPEFLSCLFDKCKIFKVEFNASCFCECKFIGKLSEVVFYGKYISDLTKGAKPNLMLNVDFSEADFGSYLVFNNCDLSTCIPPKNKTFNKLLEVVEKANIRMMK